MESMSNIPYYLMQARKGFRMGNSAAVDGMVHDGLWDPYNNQHMGNCGDLCAENYGISKEEQDAYAVRSFERALKAQQEGKLAEEIVPVAVPQRRGDPVEFSEDSRPGSVKLDKIASSR